VRQIGKIAGKLSATARVSGEPGLFPYLLDAAELSNAVWKRTGSTTHLCNGACPWAPCGLIDEIGVDVTIDIGNTLEKAYGPGAITFLPFCCWSRDGQMLGSKTGAGFYEYEGKTQTPNESLAQWGRALHGEPEVQRDQTFRPIGTAICERFWD